MAEMLKHNTTLEVLHLLQCENTVGDEGAKALVESLAVNHHLQKLKVFHVLYLWIATPLPATHVHKLRPGIVYHILRAVHV